MKQRLAATVALGLVAALAPGGVARADVIRDNEWHLRYLGVAEANRESRGAGVTVAVIDRGVERAHADLTGAVLDPAGVLDDAGPADPDGHGTALAGLIAGQGHGTDRADGMIGIAPAAKVLPVVINEITPDEIAVGIEEAVEQRARVIVVGYSVAGSEHLLKAVRAAQEADVIIVAADGDQPGRAFEPFPAGYDGVLAAIPLTREGDVRVPSSSGRRLGLGVPGFQIMTTNSGNGYRIDDGNASPGILGGAVALLRAKYPEADRDEIIRRLTLTAVDTGPAGVDPENGLGRLDLVPALTRRLPAPSPSPSASVPSSGVLPSATPVAAPADPRSRGPYGWLLGLPLLAVLAGLVAYAGLAERRIRSLTRGGRDAVGLSARDEVDSVGVQS
ncbi:S8 family serine peptidase [Dactylosporangium sp. NPDC051541]|uniref:S8 family serine peptidase n=1 Tax=Dactylosporangium sp. NPDC051541 TaxID=3363977 RepID=UPI0037931026